MSPFFVDRQNPHSIPQTESFIPVLMEESPFVRLKSSTRAYSRSTYHTPESPESPGSVSSTSSRRSVSGMKQLLPLKLQEKPPTPIVDLSSWLYDIDSPPKTSTSQVATLGSKDEAQESMLVPWMLAPQDSQLTYDIDLKSYRETPVCLEPGSPVLARFYFRNESSCNRCRGSALPCDELCIFGDYEDATTMDSCEQASFVDCAESFDERVGTSDASPTSCTKSRGSELSIKCQGDYGIECSVLRENDGQSQLRNICPDKTLHVSEHAENVSRGNACEVWLNSESSRCSSSSGNDDVLDAFATRLSPARPYVVDLTNYSQLSPEISNQSILSRKYHPSTLYSCHQRPAETQEIPRLARMRDSHNSHTSEEKGNHCGIGQSPAHPYCVANASGLDRVGLTSQDTTSLHGSQQYITQHLPRMVKSAKSVSSNSILDAIYEAIHNFPQDLLSSDSTCVVDIRRLNQCDSQQTSSHSSLVSAPKSPTDLLPPIQFKRPSLRRQTIAASVFAPLRRITSSRRRPLGHDREPEKSDPKVEHTSVLAPPDMTAIYRVFPGANDRWRSVLYAYLVAYNYVEQLKRLPKHSSCSVPWKVSRILGMPPEPPSVSASYPDTRLMEVQQGLASCIDRLAHLMAGESSSLGDMEDVSRVGTGDGILVRGLAEIVRLCERDGL